MSTNWIVLDYGRAMVEVVPETDSPQHLKGDECWCGTLINRENPDCPMIVHKSADDRRPGATAIEHGRAHVWGRCDGPLEDPSNNNGG